MLNFEKLLEEIGEFGNYQKYAIILLQAWFLNLCSVLMLTHLAVGYGLKRTSPGPVQDSLWIRDSGL